MEKRLSKGECNVWYAKYLHSKQSLPDFCMENSISYLDFSKYINQWENRHGVKMIEEGMTRTELTHYCRELGGDKIPARGETFFKELAVEPDDNQFRSRRKFPENPYFMAEMTAPAPGTIVREASIIFPSGIEVSFSGATIKSLILAVVLYEEYDTWAGK